MERREENINPNMLSWARELAGLSADKAAKKIGLRDSKSKSAIEKLNLLENGAIFPTWRQFHKIAKVYHQSPTVFFLEKPPMDSDCAYKLLKNHPNTQDISPEEKGLLIALTNNIRERQGILRSIIEDDKINSFQKIAVSMPRIDDFESDGNVKRFVKDIKSLLKFSAEKTTKNSVGNTLEIFEDLRNRIEQIGVFVLVCGNLGTYHTRISDSVFKGFAIVDDLAPFIVINENGTVQSSLFALVHELVHILAGSSRDMESLHFSQRNSHKSPIEKFCNRVASEFFIPSLKLEEIRNSNCNLVIRENIKNLAVELKLPVPLVLYVLWQSELIDQELHDTVIEKFVKNSKVNFDSDGERYHVPKPNSVNFATKRQRLGNALISRVSMAFKSHDLTRLKAAKVLNVNPHLVGRLLNADCYPTRSLKCDFPIKYKAT